MSHVLIFRGRGGSAGNYLLEFAYITQVALAETRGGGPYPC